MELEEALKKIKELETTVENLTKENTDYKAGADEFKKQLSDKDTEIAKMKDEARERGLQFKKFRDMSAEEKELLTEKEKELLQRQEQQEEEFAKFKADQDEFKKTQRDALIDSLSMKKAGGNKDIADKIKVTLGKIKDIDTKITEADLLPEIDFAFNGLAIKTTADPLAQAHNQDGMSADYQTKDSFAETTEGKSAAAAMGLSQALPDNNK